MSAGEESNEEKEQKNLEDGGTWSAGSLCSDVCHDLACSLLCDGRHEVLQVIRKRQSDISLPGHAKGCRKERKE